MAESEHSGSRRLKEGEIFAYLKKVALEELELKPEDIEHITLETPIVEGLKLDSLTQVVLITEIEEYYGLEFEPEDRESLDTLADLVTIIQERATRGGKDGADA